MNKLFPIVLLLALLALGCGGANSPVIPDTWNTVTIDGTTYSWDGGHGGQAVNPGTDTTAAELRVFYSKHFTVANFPQSLWCVNRWGQPPGAYQLFMSFFATMTDAYMFYMVSVQEAHNYDVPQADAAAAEGWLTPPC